MPKEERPPSFQFYPRDLLTSRTVLAMTLEERGAYLFLLSHAWLSDQPGTLPNDPRLLAALSGAGERWSSIAPSVLAAFTILDGRLVQPRMLEERHAQKIRFQAASQGGKLSARRERDSGGRLLSKRNPTPSSASASASAIESFAGAGPPSGADSLALTLEAPSAGSSAEILAPADTGQILTSIAGKLEMRAGAKHDPRVRLWQTALSHSNPRAPSGKIMKTLCWLWYDRGVRDWGLLDEATRLIAQAENPYALLQPGGGALESLIGKLGVARAEAEQESHKNADRRMGIAR